MRVKRVDRDAFGFCDLKIDAVFAISVQHGRRRNIVRIAINRDLFARLCESIIHGLADVFMKIRCGACPNVVRLQVRHEGRGDVRPVRINDRDASAKHRSEGGSRREHGQSRSEQEKLHVVIHVPPDDLRKDRKRRIVYDDIAGVILFLLVVPPRVKRPDEVLGIKLVGVRDPLFHGVVNFLRRVAVVRCMLRLELIQELLILILTFLSFSRVAALKPFVQFLNIETEKAHIDLADRCQVKVQLFRKEPGRHSCLVMHQGVGPALLVRQLIEPDAGRFFIPETPQRLIPAMTFDDEILIAPDSDRIVKAPAPDALHDLLDLVFRVILRVIRIRR